MENIPEFYDEVVIRHVLNIPRMTEVFLGFGEEGTHRTDTTLIVPADCLYNTDDSVFVAGETTMVLRPKRPAVMGGIAVKERPEGYLGQPAHTQRGLIPPHADIIGAVTRSQFVDSQGRIRQSTNVVAGDGERPIKEAKKFGYAEGEHAVSPNVVIYISSTLTRIAGEACKDCPAQKLCGAYTAARRDIDNYSQK